jgi:hypothetical protein
MNHFSRILICLSLFCFISTKAQLAVTVSPPKIGGQKAIVQLKMNNNLTNKVESARAMCFLMDEQGKMVGQATKWVIGQNKTGLEPKGEMTFNFVIVSPRPFATTNLTAKVSFSRLILKGGTSVNPNKEVTIEQELPLTNRVSPTTNQVVSKPLDDVIASASRRIPIKPTSRTSETIMVTNLLRPINSQQH